MIANLDSLRPKLETMADMVDGVQVSELTLRSPIANPTKIIGVPQNYQDHADAAAADTGISQGLPRRKMEDQGLFLKANSALIGPGEGVAIRFSERRTDHEAELGVIIGRKGSNIEYDDALSYVAGYAIAMDMVVRGKEDRSFRKSVDTYAVLGPWMVTADEIADPFAMRLSTRLNGKEVQSAVVGDMIFDIPTIINYLSGFLNLMPGDIISTGSPEGSGASREPQRFLLPSDKLEIEWSGIGVLTNNVISTAEL